MRTWVHDGGERYDYVRVYGISDRTYVYYLLAKAYMDITEPETAEEDFLWGAEGAAAHQRYQAVVAFIDNDISSLAN